MDKLSSGRFTIPVRIYLSTEDRTKLQHLIHTEGVDLNDLLSELLARYLDDRPLPEASPSSPGDTLEELRRRRDEIRRLKHTSLKGDHAPGWFESYLAQLEGEVARLERAVNGD